ncbi:dimethylarginine dimethylaminohydrolase family protein [Sporanaerobacter sp. PP17-6a]|uniref:dimethylarginine dimethylaminohydrolase family protein n=1 Tax=Sporanaerobacter sp. PP17-6a TaxID=1891289 RepID=UPI00089FBD09|nr:arginine deiminase family protein [Sporanaerobacter sp. PP17-6a]SCL86027.1 N(G), N(G)-dimethylargininedimethylaminohydrolase [Sporanaerobacter sp. PP17-6a]
MFKNVIVRKPCKAIVNGITSANLGKPDFELAKKQHEFYIETLKKCGVKVTILDADEKYPDSCFVEDVALCTKKCAIITRPGALSRRGEEVEMKEVLKKFYSDIEEIKEPGTVEAGDIMMVGDHFYIGLSARTNKDGAEQMISILEKYGFSGSVVPLNEMLHLKSGLAYLENNNLLIAGEFIKNPVFKDFNKIIIPEDEGYAANCIWVNDHVLVPMGYPKTQEAIKKLGYKVEIVDTSEFRKLDGGLSCLSLRF